MGLKNQFASDKTLESKGIIIDYGDARIRIARAGGANKKFAKALDRKTKPFRRAIQAGVLDNDRSNKLLMEVYAKTVVLDWETNTGTDSDPVWTNGIDPEDAGVDPVEEGGLIQVNEENILKVFLNLPDLFFDLQQQAQAGTLFRAELDEAAAGN